MNAVTGHTPRGSARFWRGGGTRWLRHPARLTVLGFAVVTAAGTGALMLPAAAGSGDATPVLTALFTAVSAVCVTGLAVVDTETHWSYFGEAVILVLIQAGGIGIMTLASLLGLLVARRMGLRMQLIAQSETKTLRLGETRRIVTGIIVMSLLTETVVAAVLASRFIAAHGHSPGRGLYLGLFHAVSAYNNAGFALWPDSLTRYGTDIWIMGPVTAALVIGGLGFPVIFEVSRALRRAGTSHQRAVAHWSLHTKLTLLSYFALAALGVGAVLVLEWGNQATIGALSLQDKLAVGVFHGFAPRTAGFNTLDVGSMNPAALLITDILMFVGGGSAGTAGGIKVTTFALLAFVMIAEVRGQPTVHLMGRRLAAEVQRQALTVALLGVGVVVTGTIALLVITRMDLDEVLFEAVSAFGTVGLSTGITADIPAPGLIVLIMLMFIGRLGPITLATALALRQRGRRYELPEERPIVG